jgi:hypothetical protein
MAELKSPGDMAEDFNKFMHSIGILPPHEIIPPPAKLFEQQHEERKSLFEHGVDPKKATAADIVRAMMPQPPPLPMELGNISLLRV